LRRPHLALAFVLALVAAGCGDDLPPRTPRVVVPPPGVDERAEVELVESAPIETTLDHADVRDAKDVWPEMIASAKHTIDLSEFYASDVGGEHEHARKKEGEKPSALGVVIAALEQAAGRGVRIRFLIDESFASKYPATVERIHEIGSSGGEKITVRMIDAAKRYGGIQHAKYMIVDGEDSFVGSQNFDWRALTHIQEMGVRVHSPAIAGGLADVFETDWALADAGSADARTRAHVKTPPETRARSGESVALYASPKGWLPDESRWDLTRLVSLIDHAKSAVDLQVLTYSTQNRDKSSFTDLDDALRRAAGRGVKVRVLVSHWGANPNTAARRSVESLAAVPNVEARVFTVPPWSGGDIPFARVSHAKYMVVDHRAAWVGTSNWEGDYFLKSRNVAIVAEDGSLAPRLGRIFIDDWDSSYAKPIPGNANANAKDNAKD
jgi:phosphatidylserine/phosphatidylglycerophosphate/cardiolipin synthase-like enzyme